MSAGTPTAATAQDAADIRNIAALYGHVIDHNEWDQLDRVYAADGCYDGTAAAAVTMRGWRRSVSSSAPPRNHSSTTARTSIFSSRPTGGPRPADRSGSP